MAARQGSSGAPPMRAGRRKVDAVERLSEKLGRATSTIVTDYRGLTVAQLEELRGQLRARNVEYMIVKNTLARRAATAAGVGAFAGTLTGPCGLAIGYDDISLPAKLLSDYFRINRRLPLVAGLVEGRVLDAEAVRAVAELPPREVLQAQLAGTLESPMTALAGALGWLLAQLAGALETRRTDLENAA